MHLSPSKLYAVLILTYNYPFHTTSFIVAPPTCTSSKSIPTQTTINESCPYRRITPRTTKTTLFALQKVGVVGTGYISALTSKLASISGYTTWMLHTPGEEDIVRKLIFPTLEEEEKDNESIKEISTKLNDNLALFPATDTEKLTSNLQDTEGIIIATDNPDEPMDGDVVQYIVENAPNLKRIIFMSRNLNLKNMGFFVKASKVSANSNVWHADTDLVKRYQAMEDRIRSVCETNDSLTYSFIRAGTLKGGGCGTSEPSDAENTYYPQYLTSEFYNMVKKDIVSWNFLFDCRTRQVKLHKGDSMPGPGNKAVFTATSFEACEGDTSRCAIAECMIRSLEGSENLDFGVGTREGREMPCDIEWKELFAKVM